MSVKCWWGSDAKTCDADAVGFVKRPPSFRRRLMPLCARHFELVRARIAGEPLKLRVISTTVTELHLTSTELERLEAEERAEDERLAASVAELDEVYRSLTLVSLEDGVKEFEGQPA